MVGRISFLERWKAAENLQREVLNLKRPLTLKMAQSLFHQFGIPAEVLLAK